MMGRANRKSNRGQAMVEYSVINFVLIIGLCVLAAVPVPVKVGAQQSGSQNIIQMFLSAYQTYYDSFYFVLNMPFP